MTVHPSAAGVHRARAVDGFGDKRSVDERISVVVAGEVAHVSLGSGAKRNALRTRDWAELAEVAEGLAARGALKVVVFRGISGNFSSGSDLSEWRSADSDYVNTTFATMESAFVAVEKLDVVTIAAIEGLAVGAGCQLALCCDLQVMARSAVIGMPIVRLGIRTSPLFALRLVEAVGATRARHLLYTGRLLGAEQAERWAVVSEVAEDSQFELRLEQLVGTVLAQPRSGLEAAKSSTDRVLRDRCQYQSDREWQYIDAAEFFDRRVCT